jgi:hypothetical protein
MSEDNQTFIIFYNLIPGGLSAGRTYTLHSNVRASDPDAGFNVIPLLKFASPSGGFAFETNLKHKPPSISLICTCFFWTL